MISLDIHLAEFRPLNDSSYIKLPEFIKSEKVVVNMVNGDEECFECEVTRAINPVVSNTKEQQRFSKAKSEKIH